MNVLVIDVGGTNVKMLATGQAEKIKFPSGPELTPARMVEQALELASAWPYDVVSLGYPGTMGRKGPKVEPGNLADGWVGFDFKQAFGKPVRIANDAALQALGAYDGGGRMLFLGLGTGLGSALVTDYVVVPLELGDLPYSRRETMAQRVGRAGLKKHGERSWQKAVARIVPMLQDAFNADYVVLGGGNADRVETLPPNVRRGGNEDAFTGGFRLWEEEVHPHDAAPPTAWRVVR